MSKFHTLLYQSDIIKTAYTEQPDNIQFERDFNNMAFAFLRDRAAPIMPYLVGFEVVDRSEDGTQGVGIFGFKIGKKFYYIPVFFLGGQIKGLISIYDKDANQFYPISEEFLNDLVNRQTISIGGMATQEEEQGIREPDMDGMIAPSVKTGSFSKKAKAVYTELQEQIKEAFVNDRKFQEIFAGIVSIKTAGDQVKVASDELRGFLKKAGVNAYKSLHKTIATNTEFLKAAAEFYDLPYDFIIEDFHKKASDPEDNLVILTEGKGSTAFETKNILNFGFHIRDNRKQAEVSEIFDGNSTDTFETVGKSGRYSILTIDGKFKDYYILMLPSNCYTESTIVLRDDPAMLAIAGDTISMAYANPKPVANKQYATAEALFKIAKPLSTIKETDHSSATRYTYYLIDDSGKNVGKITDVVDRSVDNGIITLNCYGNYLGEDIRTLAITSSKTVVPSVSNNVGYAPLSKIRCFKVNTDKKITFPSLSDFKYMLYKDAKLHRLDVYSPDGYDFTISVDGFKRAPVGYKEATITLVRDIGLRELDALNILKEAAIKFKTNKLVKFGQQMLPTVAPQMPYADPSIGVDPQTGAPMQTSVEAMAQSPMVGVPPLQDPTQPGFATAEFQGAGAAPSQPAPIDPEIAELAQQAAASGQKNVFNQAVIGGLAKLQDVDELIDSFIPNFMDTMDKLGRVLFLFYWKADRFIERYGEETYKDMEDQLKSVYRSFGELVLTFRQKAVKDEDTMTIED